MMQAAIDPGYAVFGQDAIYTDRDLNDKPCRIVLSFDLAKWGDAITVTSYQAMVNVRRSEIAGRPRRGETFTTAMGQVFAVEQVLTATEYEYMVLAVEQP